MGGSCSGDPFKEDSTNTWDYMPLSATWLDFRVRFSWTFSTPGGFFREDCSKNLRLLQSAIQWKGKDHLWRIFFGKWLVEQIFSWWFCFIENWTHWEFLRSKGTKTKIHAAKKTADMETLRKKDKFSERLFLRYSPWIRPCLFTLFFWEKGFYQLVGFGSPKQMVLHSPLLLLVILLLAEILTSVHLKSILL